MFDIVNFSNIHRTELQKERWFSSSTGLLELLLLVIKVLCFQQKGGGGCQFFIGNIIHLVAIQSCLLLFVCNDECVQKLLILTPLQCLAVTQDRKNTYREFRTPSLITHFWLLCLNSPACSFNYFLCRSF